MGNNVKIKAGVNTTRGAWNYVFSLETQENLKKILDFNESLIAEEKDPSIVQQSIVDAEVILSTWQAVPYTEEMLASCPDLKMILYGAGSVKGFVTDALLAKKGVKVCSAIHLNAIPVAEFTLGLILTSLKNVFPYYNDFKHYGKKAWEENKTSFNGGYYQTKVGLVGFGEISKHLLILLKSFDFALFITSQHISKEEEKKYNVKNVSLDHIMANCDVVSLHAANVPANWGMINRDNLKLMKKGARLINTARGRLIVETDLVEKLKEVNIEAYLDVTYPEPPREGHPFYSLPNCILTPHIAGSVGMEVHRMGDYCYRELLNWLEGRPLENQIDIASLAERA